MSEDSTQSLFQGFFDRSLGPGEKEQLEALLLSSPEARESFRRMARVHGMLSHIAEIDKGLNAAARDPVITQLISHRPPVVKTKRSSTKTWLLVGLASAACISLIANLFQLNPPKSSPQVAIDQSPGLANITSKGLIEWSASSHKPRGSHIDAGLYQFQFGSLRLQMAAGALVSIAAPCEFEIISDTRIDVKYGKLTARLPNDEDELVITMPGLTLTDLGTGFGVDVGSNGKSVVSVFEGKVQLDEDEGSPSTILTAGNSISHNPETGNEITPLKFQSSQFIDLWPLTLGIEEASSLIHFLPPGPKYPPLKHYSDIDHLFLVPEKQTIRLKRPLLLDMGNGLNSWPGKDPNPVDRPRIPRGKKISSYLVFYNPPHSDGPRTIQTLSGELTFDRKIAGVICTNRTLIPSNPVLGAKNRYFQPLLQPSEAKDARDQDAILPHDSFQLSSDLRSIYFNLNVTRGIDSFRIILEDS